MFAGALVPYFQPRNIGLQLQYFLQLCGFKWKFGMSVE